MINKIGWAIAGLSIIGVVLNIYKLEACFYIWAVTNAVWAVIDWKKDIKSQAMVHVVYFGLAIWGIIKW